jgi:hypothetical protein
MPYRKGISATEKNVVIWIVRVKEISVIASKAKLSSFPWEKAGIFANAPLNDGGSAAA